MKPYKDYADFLRRYFPGKMQKLTVNPGFGCPNRDGTLSFGGCAYCNNSSFSPELGRDSIAEQLQRGKEFFARKYPEMRYLAYFQSYTNTYASPQLLMQLYREALTVDGIDGLVIGTRPDCIDLPLLRLLRTLPTKVFLEFGAESSHDVTLKAVNRCHTWQQTVDAVHIAADEGFPVGLHFIMGLPGETKEMMLETVEKAVALPVDTLKFHQLQIVRGSAMGKAYLEYLENAGTRCDEARTQADQTSPFLYGGMPVTIWEPDDYMSLCCKMVEVVNNAGREIFIERFTSSSPAELRLAPNWGMKNYEFTNLLLNRLRR